MLAKESRLGPGWARYDPAGEGCVGGLLAPQPVRRHRRQRLAQPACPEFYGHLQRLIEAGFGKRIMWGSDQMVWPWAIDVAIEAIEQAPFLSEEQKRDIFYNNAARFLRLSDTERTRHQGARP